MEKITNCLQCTFIKIYKGNLPKTKDYFCTYRKPGKLIVMNSTEEYLIEIGVPMSCPRPDDVVERKNRLGILSIEPIDEHYALVTHKAANGDIIRTTVPRHSIFERPHP